MKKAIEMRNTQQSQCGEHTAQRGKQIEKTKAQRRQNEEWEAKATENVCNVDPGPRYIRIEKAF